jgi:hypothetical protein
LKSNISPATGRIGIDQSNLRITFSTDIVLTKFNRASRYGWCTSIGGILDITTDYFGFTIFLRYFAEVLSESEAFYVRVVYDTVPCCAYLVNSALIVYVWTNWLSVSY